MKCILSLGKGTFIWESRKVLNFFIFKILKYLVLMCATFHHIYKNGMETLNFDCDLIFDL